MNREKRDTLPDILSYRAEKKADEVLYKFLKDGEKEEVPITYGELDRKARCIGSMLQNLGGENERVLLLFPPGLSYIAAFFGCLYGGSTAVPLYPPKRNRHDERLQAVLEDSGAKIALTTKDILGDLKKRFDLNPALASLKWIATDDIQDSGAPEGWVRPSLNPESIAYLQYTSGSTSTPKGVVIRHSNVMQNLEYIHRCFGLSENSKGFIWLPPYHDMGLVGGILEPLYAGFPIVLMDPVVFMQKPMRWLKAISDYKATCSGGPDFAYELCTKKVTPEQLAELDLSSWELAFNGAEPIRAETMENFAKTFASCGFRKEAFYPCYGLAEATLIVSGGDKQSLPCVREFDADSLAFDVAADPKKGQKRVNRLVGCGGSMIGDIVEIVQPESLEVCGPDRCGEIWVQGKSIAAGYWNNPIETKRCFEAYTKDGKGPFLRTGDMGFFKDGELFITGRIKDVIIIRGRNHYPQDIELTVEKCHPALHAKGCAAFSVERGGQEELIIVQEAERTLKQEETEDIYDLIRSAIANNHELRAADIVLVRSRSIPRTSSGKIRRFATRQLYLNGELMQIARSALQSEETTGHEEEEAVEIFSAELLKTMPENERRTYLEKFIRQEVSRIIRMQAVKIEPDQPLSQLGLDSLMAVELQQVVEDKFSASIPLVKILADFSLRNIAEAVYEQRQALSLTAANEFNTAGNQDGIYPVSHGQQGIWFMQGLNPKSSAYHIIGSFKVDGSFNSEAAINSFKVLIKNHQSLRTVFTMKDGQVVQKILAEGELSWTEEAASGLDHIGLEKRMLEEAHKPFDLENGPLFRVYLFHKSSSEHYLLFVIHHIISDFWSLSILTEQFGMLYAEFAEGGQGKLEMHPYSYGDFACWQKEMLAGERGEVLRKFWGDKLNGDLPVLNIPTDFKRPGLQTYEGASASIQLPAKLIRSIRDLSRSEGVTAFTVMLSAYYMLLNKYTKQDEIIVGTLVANREKDKKIFGYFVNPLALRLRIPQDLNFGEVIRAVRDCTLDAFAHQDYPFDLLVEQLRPKRDLSYSPIFQTVFSFQRTPGNQNSGMTAFTVQTEGIPFELGGLSLTPVPLPTQTAQYDLTMTAAELGNDKFVVSLEYNKALFKEETIVRMLEHYRSLIEKALENSEMPVSKITPLTEEEKTLILEKWNQTKKEYDKKATLQGLFKKQALLTPEKTAVVSDGLTLTYAELDKRTDLLAVRLKNMGVKPGDLVGICLRRSVRIVVAMLGILKAGAAYVPLDPAHPRDRLTYVLEEIGQESTPILLTEKSVMDILAPLPVKPLFLDGDETDEAPIYSMKDQDLEIVPDLAYVIYTSGSTGKPKGVEIGHKALVNFLLSMASEPGITDEDILLSVTTPSFDIAGLELFLPLITGTRVVIASNEAVLDGSVLASLIEACGATIMQATPATWRLMLEAGWTGNKGLKVLCGGEPFPVDLADTLIGCSKEVWNMYGPTETTIWSTVEKLDKKGGPVLIGHPIANTRVYVLDESGQPLPIGVPGELYIGGDGLARGYFKKEELTRERFVEDPFTAEIGSKMYRTGDLVRLHADGRLEHLGRLDSQVKIRGFRIELDEISSVLVKHEAIKQAVAACKQNSRNENFLAAYLVMEDGNTGVPDNLKDFLKQSLPEYMVPVCFTILKELPLTPNGKVDRKALPQPLMQDASESGNYVEPSAGLQKVIADKWCKALGLERVGAHDNFFDLGGHSILMSSVLNMLKEEGVGQELSIVEMFQYPTVQSLARYLEEKNSKESPREDVRRIDTLKTRQINMREQKNLRREIRRGKN